MKDDNEDTTIPVGTLVEIHGLESEAGKKLNGGQGFIFKKPIRANDNLRYPVKLYALLSSDGNSLESEEALNAPTKSIKESNLKVLVDQKQEVFKKAAYTKLKSLLELEEPAAHSIPWYVFWS